MYITSGVTFVSAKPTPPIKYLITLTKQDEVSRIKHNLLKLIPDKLTHSLVIGEVLNYHIAKILVRIRLLELISFYYKMKRTLKYFCQYFQDDNYQVRYVDDVNRSIYAFEQLLLTPRSNSDCVSSDVG